jgi:hypothetical protein
MAKATRFGVHVHIDALLDAPIDNEQRRRKMGSNDKVESQLSQY